MVRELRRMIADGRLGRIQQIHIEMPQEGYLRKGADPQAWRRRDYGVPTVSLDLGVHVHHLIDFLSNGKKPRRVVGDHTHYGQFEGIVDNVYCLSHYEDDLRVQAWWGKTALGYRNGLRIRVFGSKASAEWYQMVPEDLHWSDADGHHFVLDRGSGEAETAKQIRDSRLKARQPSRFIEAFGKLFGDIAENLRAFTTASPMANPFVYGADHAKEGLQFLETIKRSATERSWLHIDCCPSR
jgi:predicted dehydrogenase